MGNGEKEPAGSVWTSMGSAILTFIVVALVGAAVLMFRGGRRGLAQEAKEVLVATPVLDG